MSTHTNPAVKLHVGDTVYFIRDTKLQHGEVIAVTNHGTVNVRKNHQMFELPKTQVTRDPRPI